VSRIFVAALLAKCCVDAHAKAVAYIPNKLGGRITFTDQPCRINGKWAGAQVYATNKHNIPSLGCWTIGKPGQVNVRWIDLPMEVSYDMALMRELESV
jgi:hypothetical protein